jgi:undecaprenyl-diphosphatase
VRARDAALLGALHGPAELVPVSSSAHVALVPWLAGWERGPGWTPARRKELEVALHAGTGVGLAWVLRREAALALRSLDRRRFALHACALLPPVVAGGLLERPIEERLGTPGATAAGLVLGAAMLAAADVAGAGRRAAGDAGLGDGLMLGLAQAAALVPGVSRRGATLAAARLRGFARADAGALSWEVALPVLVAATVRKASRVVAAPPPPVERRALAVGAVASLVATLATGPALLRAVERAPWWPYACERLVLAGAVALRTLRGRRRACQDGRR